MKRENVIANAQEITNGTKFEVKYLKPADVYNKRNYLKNKGVPVEQLPPMKEGGALPSIVLYKRTTFTLNYDERPYFEQCLEEQAQNLNPVKQESDYTHVRGAHYQKVDPKTGETKDYVRFCIRADRLETAVKYTTDKKGKSEVEYNDIVEFLQASARKDYECYNRQTDGITSTGKPATVEIVQMTLDVDKILSVHFVQ